VPDAGTRTADAMTKMLLTILATAVALAGPAAAGGAEIPRVYRGDWCSPSNGGPFFSRGRCNDGDGRWVKIARNFIVVNEPGYDPETTCRLVAIKPDTGPSHLVTLRCDAAGTETRRLEFVPRSGDGRKSERLYIDEIPMGDQP